MISKEKNIYRRWIKKNNNQFNKMWQQVPGIFTKIVLLFQGININVKSKILNF